MGLTPADLLAALAAQGILVTADVGRLRVRGGPVPEPFASSLRALRSEVADLLRVRGAEVRAELGRMIERLSARWVWSSLPDHVPDANTELRACAMTGDRAALGRLIGRLEQAWDEIAGELKLERRSA
jgi:hypothetical protein